MDKEKRLASKRAWQERNREKTRINARAYYQDNKEAIKERHRKWREGNKVAIKAHSHIWYLENRERELRKYHLHKEELKKEVLTYYGGGKLACSVCGESRMPCLSIDHTAGRNRQHKRITGHTLYHWLKKQGFPGGYMTLCMNCQFIKRVVFNECGRLYG